MRGGAGRARGDIDDAERVCVFVAVKNSRAYGNDKRVGCQLLRAAR